MAIVEALIANGVDTLFGLPGAQLYALFDALQQRIDLFLRKALFAHRRAPAEVMGLALTG